MKFYDQFLNRPPADEEVNSGELITESAGYIPAEVQIMEMIESGKRLGEFRKENYDFAPDDEDDGRVDPTREKGFDMADASQIDLRLSAKFKEAEKEQKEEMKEMPEKPKEGKEDGNTP